MSSANPPALQHLDDDDNVASFSGTSVQYQSQAAVHPSDDQVPSQTNVNTQPHIPHPPGDSAPGHQAPQMAEDILTIHRRHNCAPCLPNNSQLLAIRQQQASSTNQATHENPTNSDGQDCPATSSANPPVPTNPLAGRSTEQSEPWQLQYYDLPTCDIIKRTKQFSHCWWPHHASSITRLLWEDLGNWRSSLRKKARIFVTQSGLFLRDGLDAERHANNLAHPALSGLVIDFFYTGPTAVGKLFLEVFAQEVPRVMVALAATALKVILDEIASSQGEVNFQVTTYLPVYRNPQFDELVQPCPVINLEHSCLGWDSVSILQHIYLFSTVSSLAQTREDCPMLSNYVQGEMFTREGGYPSTDYRIYERCSMTAFEMCHAVPS
ncbi:hypothetical protein OG21DRAFT_1527584 [Imleria badia]|nr:hypothetical protein OG21DRAFT_1527584 [Imleria badia]